MPSAAKKASTKALQADCDRFNRFAPVGRRVRVDPGPLFGGELQSVTIAEPGAYLIRPPAPSAPQAVVSVSGGLGHVPLASVRFESERSGSTRDEP